MTLSDLQKGMIATITDVDADQPGVLRLMTLGLVEKTRIRHLHSAIGGDPIEIEVMGASVSVRKEQARHFTVEHT